MTLVAPNNEKKVLLHTCCAPCAGSLIERMKESGIEVTIYYYNPNIYPASEYELRKNESKAYAKKINIPFVEGSYNYEQWQDHIKGFENEPERGKRCTLCFVLRLDELARYAYENEFKVITSSLGISRWKNIEQITQCGIEAAQLYPEVTYWNFNWRKEGGSQRMYEIAKHNHFYKQEYCGCYYSLLETNAWREKNNKPKIATSSSETKEKNPEDHPVKRY